MFRRLARVAVARRAAQAEVRTLVLGAVVHTLAAAGHYLQDHDEEELRVQGRTYLQEARALRDKMP